jgi:hypothetical protein
LVVLDVRASGSGTSGEAAESAQRPRPKRNEATPNGSGGITPPEKQALAVTRDDEGR